MSEADQATAPVALAELYVAHRLRLVRLAVLLVDDLPTAEDVVHDVFASLAGRSAPEDPSAALHYLQKAVVNRARSALRRRRTARAYVAPAEPAPGGPESAAVLDEEHREVLAALAGLAARQRAVLVLRFWAELSEAEIAETLGISRGTVKSTASRALDRLQARMEELR
ncbi:MAG: sigma-70 family RNA polymerase sigma factor [Nocardioidaceae bacterium]